jgi:preprotein translocase subunit SecY
LNAQRRGWIALGSGIVLVLFTGAVAIWVDRLLSANGLLQRDSTAAAFFGRLNVAFALVIVSGILGTCNGWSLARTGRRNNVLVIALVVVFVAALFVAYTASSMYQS